MGLAVLVVLLPVGWVTAMFLNLFHAHEHCMKGAGLSLSQFALEHKGKYPFHTNGFGDALIVLLKELPDDPRLFTAPGDDGSLLKKYLKTEGDVPEERCTRAYVQWLSESNNPDIALLFDRYPTRGGDHFRRPWGPPLREVWLLGGGHSILNESAWPEFARKQIELLVAEGIPRSEAEKYFLPPEK